MKSKASFLLWGWFLFIAATAALAQVTVQNASFETPSVSVDTYTATFGSLNGETGISGWTFGPSSGASFNGIVAVKGALGSGKVFPDGQQAAFLQGTGTFSQSINFPAGQYLLTFMALGRSGLGPNPVAVSIDGNLIQTITPGTANWTSFSTAAFTVTAGNHTVSFGGTAPFISDVQDLTTFIDNVAIVLVAPLPPTLNVVFMGDSITAGVGLSSNTPAPPAVCSAILQAKLVKYNVVGSNQGHSGHTTVDFLPGGSDFTSAEQAARNLQGSSPGDLVFSIMLGTNDSAQYGPTGSPVSPSNYDKNLKTIIDQLLADFPKSRVFIHHSIWYSPNTQNSSLYGDQGLARLQTYFPVIDSLVAGYATTKPGHVFTGDTQGFSYFSINYLTEQQAETGVQGTFYLHPNAIGAASLGKFWAEAMMHQSPFDPNGK